MVSVSSTSGISQSALQQLSLQQAKRNADQAEERARTLKAQADEAQQAANQSQERARTLEIESSQAQENASRARSGLASLKASPVEQTMTTLSKVASKTASQAPTPTPTAATQPVTSVNSQGQVTGKLVNVVA